MAAVIGTKQDMLSTPVWRRDRMLHAAGPVPVHVPLRMQCCLTLRMASAQHLELVVAHLCL